MHIYYTDRFVLPLPEGHRFPMRKYSMLRSELQLTSQSFDFIEPKPATRGQLALAHCPHYVESVFSGALSAQQQRDIGFPWSEAMVERSIRSVGATIEAAFSALQHGASVNLAGGTHHAAHACGGGFCVFNDIVVAARVLQAHRLAQRKPEPKVLIIDLDVHQGDGSAQITANDASIFTFSIHGRDNYPFNKAHSDLDVALDTGTEDREYLEALSDSLITIDARFKPDFIFYLAGMDAHRADRLGKLALSDEGIERRDELVFSFAKRLGVPVAVSMGGGYFTDLDYLVALQAQTVLRLYKNCFLRA